MSTLRLRFGEPVRFRFLAGMMSSAYGQKDLLAAGMQFLNSFIGSSSSRQDRVYIQAELEQAGFDIDIIKKNVGSNFSPDDNVLEEIRRWENSFIDIECMQSRLEEMEKENVGLRGQVHILEKKVKVLQEEKGVLIDLEHCLKERCSELQGEVHSLKSENLPNKVIKMTQTKDESGPEDEGISSSECSPSPDDVPHHTQLFSVYGTQCSKAAQDDEEETTIEEVIEELENIVNKAQTDDYNKQELQKSRERKLMEEAQIAGKLHMQASGEEYFVSGECEIVPANLHPQPPRRTKSLVHLFPPPEDYGYCNKEFFFENETTYSSDEGSDSLLSASRCFLMPSNTPEEPTRRSKISIKRSGSFRHVSKALSISRVTIPAQQKPVPEPRKRIHEVSNISRCKSFERMDKGLDDLVDIVVTGNSADKPQFRSKSDSGNASGTSLCRSVSNVFVLSSEHKSKLSAHSEEKQKMFLPTKIDQYEVPYYFPRIQEKKSQMSAGFLIKRGHTNAGLYSGQVLIDNQVMVAKSREVITFSSSISGKLSDFPSGLY